jgi:site-specific DNA-methyltransferase (adenine-specific)
MTRKKLVRKPSLQHLCYTPVTSNTRPRPCWSRIRSFCRCSNPSHADESGRSPPHVNLTLSCCTLWWKTYSCTVALLPIFQTEMGLLVEGDCLAIMPSLEAQSVDLVFADPPFNLGKTYSSNISDALEEQEYLDWSKRWITEALRLLKPGGSFFLFNLPKWNLRLGDFLDGHLTFRHWIAINMTYRLPIHGRLYPSHYSLLYFVKGPKPAIFHPDRLPIETCRHCGGEKHDYGGYKDKMNPRGVNLTDVWDDIPPVRHSKYKRRKANELSLKLLDRVLTMASDPGSLVFDPFGGSGTTFVAAELLGRRWVGTELHCADAIARLRNTAGDLEYLRKVALEKNVLFKPGTLHLRRKNGHRSDRYQVTSNAAQEPCQKTLLLQ